MNEELLPEIFNGSGITTAIRVSRGRSGSVWHAACPNCGGSDRVFLLERSRHTGKPFGMCRQCGTLPKGYKWSYASNPEGYELSEADRRAWEAKRRQAEIDRLRDEDEEKAKFASEAPWIPFVGAEREYWRRLGISDELQDYWQLGYCQERRYQYHGEWTSSPAYTIPKFALGGKPVNMDFRLTDPQPGAGRYRPYFGLPPAPFINYPEQETLSDEVFVLEGSKKAMVCSAFVHRNLGSSSKKTFFGIPSQNSWADVPDMLQDCGRVWYLPDPDAIVSGWADTFACAVGGHCRIVELPEKPDDMITDYGVGWAVWSQAFKYARPGRDVEE